MEISLRSEPDSRPPPTAPTRVSAGLRTAAGLALLLLLAGCGGAARGPSEPVVAPTGKVYERGTPPEETRQSQTASLYLNRDRTERALELAQEGAARDSGNPVHYYLAGVAHARLGHYEAADSLLAEAERIYPAYELEVEPARRAAWARAFNAGSEAYADGNVERAIEAWRGATTIYDLRPRAHRSLARALVEQERPGEAIEIYREALAGLEDRPATRVLEEEEVRQRRSARAEIERTLARLLLREERYAEAVPLLRRRLEEDTGDTQLRQELARTLSRLGRHEEADELYASLLSEDELEATQLLNLGLALFRSGEHDRAGEAFARLTKRHPHSRDAWYNYVNALFAAENWKRAASVGERLLELDPLGENAGLIVARAHLESGDEAAARELVARVEEAPVHLGELEMQRSGSGSTVSGRVRANAASAGTRVDLRFVFYGQDGQFESRTLTVSAPPQDEDRRFSVSIDARAEAYRYELAGRGASGR